MFDFEFVPTNGTGASIGRNQLAASKEPLQSRGGAPTGLGSDDEKWVKIKFLKGHEANLPVLAADNELISAGGNISALNGEPGFQFGLRVEIGQSMNRYPARGFDHKQRGAIEQEKAGPNLACKRLVTDFLLSAQIPESDGASARARGCEPAVGRDRPGRHAIFLFRKPSQQLGTLKFPEANRTIIGPGEKISTFGRESAARDRILVPIQAAFRSCLSQIPNIDAAVPGGGDQQFAAGVDQD